MSLVSSETFRVEYAEMSDLGMRRATNQDSVATMVAPPGKPAKRGDLFLVADGMGAHAAGELASKLAIDCIPHTYGKLTDAPPQAALRQAVRKANSLINAKGRSSPEFQGMGTTCSCLVLLRDTALVAHVGDSRVYRLRGGQLEQLTFDHSLVWEMAAASHTSTDNVPACIPKNVITRSLGPHEQVNVDLEGPYPLADGDVFLICSDGLTGVVEDELIGAVIGAMPPQEAGQTLIDLANLRGGPDNISAVIARVTSSGESRGKGPCALKKPPAARPGVLSRVAWLSFAACLAAGVWFGVQQQGLSMLVATGVGGVSLGVALMRRHALQPEEPATALGGPYGNGPYREFNCAPGEPAAAAMAEVVDQLAQLEQRQPADPGPPPIDDWKGFHAERDQAVAASDAGDPAAAVRHFGAAIRTLMEQVRGGATMVYPAKDSAV